jgi:hypothetical protein
MSDLKRKGDAPLALGSFTSSTLDQVVITVMLLSSPLPLDVRDSTLSVSLMLMIVMPLLRLLSWIIT